MSDVTIPRDLLEALIEQHITAHGYTNATARAAQASLYPARPMQGKGEGADSVKRYHPDFTAGFMDDDSEGDYVLASDYAALETLAAVRIAGARRRAERALASAQSAADYASVPVECTPAMECYGEDEAYRLGLRGVEKGMIASIWRTMAKAAPMPKLPPVWMPVTSDAPMPGVPVLAWSEGQDAYIGKRHNEHTWTSPDCDYSFTGVSHWMPIPTPPSGGGN